MASPCPRPYNSQYVRRLAASSISTAADPNGEPTRWTSANGPPRKTIRLPSSMCPATGVEATYADGLNRHARGLDGLAPVCTVRGRKVGRDRR